MGILDLLMFALCARALSFYYSYYTNYYALFFSTLLVIMLYIFMRFYIYTLMVTFDLKFFQILKNAAIFTLLGFGRNFLLFCGCIMLVLFTIWLINMNRKAERCSLERSKAIKQRVHDQNSAERKNWLQANLELHAQNELLRNENEQYKKTLAMAGVEDVAEFRKWMEGRK
jgi:hypothetical protein